MLSAILPVLLLTAALARPSLAVQSAQADTPAAAATILQRFIAGPGAGRWPVETVDIEAALPKLKKPGRLRAIRTLIPAGQPEYQVLEIAGDSTVKNQVIVRYLSAEDNAIAFAVFFIARSLATGDLKARASRVPVEACRVSRTFGITD